MLTKNFWNIFNTLVSYVGTGSGGINAYNLTTTSGSDTSYSVVHYNSSSGWGLEGGSLVGMGGASTPSSSANVYASSLYTITNNTTLYYGNSSVSINTSASTPKYCRGVVLGTGTTTPSASDYSLSGTLITTFTAVTSVNTAIKDNNQCEIIGTYQITNTGSSSFTIGEIGLIAGTSATYADGILLDRTVLSTPLTIPAGETKTLVYRITFAGSSAN